MPSTWSAATEPAAEKEETEARAEVLGKHARVRRVARRRWLQWAKSEGFLWEKVRRRWRGWKLSGATEKVLGWVWNGVPCYWTKGEPAPWNLGSSRALRLYESPLQGQSPMLFAKFE
jgi:hypothetical protein